uniref:DUF523 domain-containing protein n=1 Tax=Halostreptopolyspora alba TaxID=2487137 RepID=UPI00371C3D8F
MATAQTHGVRVALLKESGPSCGLHHVYDGERYPGPGVTAQLLLDHGISVYTENEIEAAAARLHELEKAS